MTPELERALVNLRDAVAFFDKVKTSSADERAAVGRDHFDWLEKAARKVVKESSHVKTDA